ncbi:hypothetical protein DO70_5329 [Burkholderia pseudomallei]|nr:hypothetical protein DO70_5329 [Burkholderia pseudomallei]
MTPRGRGNSCTNAKRSYRLQSESSDGSMAAARRADTRRIVALQSLRSFRSSRAVRASSERVARIRGPATRRLPRDAPMHPQHPQWRTLARTVRSRMRRRID